MTKTGAALQTGGAETVLLNLDVGVLGALYRTAIGFAVLPGMSLLFGRDVSDWMLIPVLLVVLSALRLGLAVLRRALRIPDATKNVWAQRRRMAKRHDSYQWQKLVWIGLGLILYMVVSGEHSSIRIGTGLACLLAGAVGTARWYALCRGDKSAGLPTGDPKRLA